MSIEEVFCSENTKTVSQNPTVSLAFKNLRLANIGSIMVPRDFGAGHLKLNY